MSVGLETHLGDAAPAVDARLQTWDADATIKRLWEKDPTVWFPEDRPELTERLGWLDLPETMADRRAGLVAFADEIAAEGFRDVIVLGMGGSSLAPEVYQATFGNAPGRPQLHVLDSTHPGSVIAMERSIEPARSLFVVSSKSGGTLETMSFLRHFWSVLSGLTDEPGRHFVAITDPGSSLADLAAERSFRRLFLAPTDVGGRYSALTEFGLVPAALIGADLAAMETAARDAARASGPGTAATANPAAVMGAAMGELAASGRDKVTFLTSPSLDALPAWIEQLLAESTGKDGRGIVPIGGEPAQAATAYGTDRFFVIIDSVDEAQHELADALATEHPVVRLTLDTVSDLAGVMFLLEAAVALAGSVLGIHPFNQPDVQLAKDLAKRAMAGDLETGDVELVDALDPDLAGHVRRWLAGVSPGEYVGIDAYLVPVEQTRAILQSGRLAVRDGRRVATTLDFGPRFLHSTGQLHKGGPNTGRFLVVIDDPTPELAVPETDFDFGSLITAQAMGDHQALVGRGRKVLLVSVGGRVDAGLDALHRAVVEAAGG